MQRNFRRLGDGPFDLLVVGGGIYGAWTAYDAALRGLRVALVEQTDWASATSSASSKLIHGGLRYLEHGWLNLVRVSLGERRRLARLAPHRVRPLRLALPVYVGDRVGPFKLRAGLWIYDRLAGSDQPVEPHRFLGPDELVRKIGLRREGLRGGFTFGDCQTDDSRFTLEIVDGAVTAGAVAANRARATRLIVEHGRVGGAAVADAESGEALDVRAGVTVDCTGAWSGRLCDSTDPAPVRWTKGVHLVLPRLASDLALLIVSNDDDRIVFVLPWYGRTLVGTTDTDYTGALDAPRIEDADVRYLLERVKRVLPDVHWSATDVIGGFAGLRSFPASANRAPSARSREWSLSRPRPGLLRSVGGKYTSARADAAQIVDAALDSLGRTGPGCMTEDRPFPWCPDGAFDAWRIAACARGVHHGLDEETADGCALRYGSGLDRVLERIEARPDLARRLVAAAPFCRAEIAHAIDAEMARGLVDILRRRLPLMLLAPLESEALRDAADLAGERFDWPESRRRHEIETVRSLVWPTAPRHEPV